jgi:superfamily II DNA/RNA helicase
VFAKGPTVETLRRIKERLENNQNLNSAAIHGMKTAKARLADLENVRDHLTTYTPSGGVTIVPTKPSRVEKKS